MANDAESRAARRRAEATRWPVRKLALGEQRDIDPLDARSPSELVASVWELTLASWSAAGRDLPDYERSAMPGKVIRGGAR